MSPAAPSVTQHRATVRVFTTIWKGKKKRTAGTRHPAPAILPPLFWKHIDGCNFVFQPHLRCSILMSGASPLCSPACTQSLLNWASFHPPNGRSTVNLSPSPSNIQLFEHCWRICRNKRVLLNSQCAAGWKEKLCLSSYLMHICLLMPCRSAPVDAPKGWLYPPPHSVFFIYYPSLT